MLIFSQRYIINFKFQELFEDIYKLKKISFIGSVIHLIIAYYLFFR